MTEIQPAPEEAQADPEAKESAPELKMKIIRGAMLPQSAGGVYIPPFKLRKVLEGLKNQEQSTPEHQKYQWEILRKRINGIVNKVNVTNIHNVVVELFGQNLLRGKGLLARAIMKAQTAATGYSHVFAALVAIINTKLPDVVKLLVHRVIL